MRNRSMIQFHAFKVVMSKDDFIEDIDFLQWSQIIIQFKPNGFSEATDCKLPGAATAKTGGL